MSGAWDNGARKWIFTAGAAAFFVLALGALRPLRAQITGTAGFETGLHKLATVTMNKSAGATVNWGDGTNNSDGLLNCHYGLLSPNKCDILGTHRYAKNGNYSISIAYGPPLCITVSCVKTAKATATISSPGDFVILTIGDSIASGQGTPVVNYAPLDAVSQGYWDDPASDYNQSGACARSRKSGFVQAQNEVQKNNPAITTINFSCSGDTVDQTIAALRSARGSDPKRIDVLLISVGADNIDGGFGKFIGKCLPSSVSSLFTPCSQDPTFVKQTSDDIASLGSCQTPAGPITSCYPKLAQEINCINPNSGLQETNCTNPDLQIPKLVLITNYMDITHDQTGNYPTLAADPTCAIALAALRSDWDYFYNGYLIPLNEQVDNFPRIAAAAGLGVPTYAIPETQSDFYLHGYCAGHPGGTRWVNDILDSQLALGIGTNGESATGHPNNAGEADYKAQIYAAIVEYNPPATTAIATTADGASYTFGTWTNQDVDVTFSSTNAIKEAGVGSTFYAVDNTNCFSLKGDANCTEYTGPVTISDSGQHTLTYFGTNSSGNPEETHNAQVLIDRNPPLAMDPGTQTIRRLQSATYNVNLGHVGWDTQTVNLTCTTDDPQATCTMNPSSVALDQTTTATAVVNTAPGGASSAASSPAQPQSPIGLPVLRALLALVTALFLVATGLAVRRRRWVRVSSFAALAVLFGVLCAGCGSTTSAKTYTVTVTGVSGNTTNTASSTLLVQ